MTVDEAMNIAVIHTLSIKHGSAVSEAAEAASILAAEVRLLRDEVNGLTGSLDRAENALKEAQEQEPVAWINLNKWTPSNGPRCVTHEEYEKERELLTKLTAVYAAPVPAVTVPAEWREVLTELADDLSIELDMRYQSRSHYPSELRKYENEMQLIYRARALLQSVGEKK